MLARLAFLVPPALLASLALGLACSADARSSAESPGEAPPSVVLISLDGTRPADLTSDGLPSLLALSQRGLVAEGLVPVDPSNTFPNHVSLATGVRPDVHRLVNNSFIDPLRGRFDRSRPHDWIESEPIWSIAERHGLRSASFYWVGSEGPWTQGPGPSDTRRFSSRTGERAKVDQILAWLAVADPATRPRLILSWFHGADHAGHVHGPGSPESVRALAGQDREIARLVATMEERGLFASTTLVFVSDHGMVGAERRVNLSRALRHAGLKTRVMGIGGFASVVLREPGGRDDESADRAARVARVVAVARAEGLEAHPRERAPEDWHVREPRFGDVVVRAPTGTAIVTATSLIEGFHGYDAREPAMAGLLVAAGRGVVPGTRLGRVSNLAIAPTVLRLLGLPAPAQMETPPIEAMLVGLDALAEPPVATTPDPERKP